MKNRLIVTIGRQYGSGGRSIGEKLAQELDLTFYDKELINIASKESGICGEFFEKADEKYSSPLWGNFFLGNYMLNGGGYYQGNDYLSGESLFKMQSDVIKKLAESGNSLMVGRCADYILRDDPECVSVFICADLEDRVRRVADYENVAPNDARRLIEKTDKMRASYYNYYTDKIWGAASSYDLCINSSFYGEEKTLEVIKDFCLK